MISFKAVLRESCTSNRPFTLSLPLTITEIDAQYPGEHEVLVRIQAASLCWSDLSVITEVRAWSMPIFPGHEASGIVEQVGANVTQFSAGDQVVLV